jgi:hypothetical protein
MWVQLATIIYDKEGTLPPRHGNSFDSLLSLPPTADIGTTAIGMPFIDDNREVARHLLSNEDWIRFLPGKCPLARMMLPYLARFERESSIHVAGIEDHDYFMSMHAIVVLMMASTVKSNDVGWLEDNGLMSTLKEFESEGFVPYQSQAWTEKCMKAMQKCFVVGGFHLQKTSDIMADVSAPTDGRTHASTMEIAGLVDEVDVQMLKDVFYIVTGDTTWDDTDSSVSPTDKSARTDGVPINAEEEEELTWAPHCPTMDSKECGMGVCSHYTGLTPLIGVPWHPEYVLDGDVA